jgi:hypothetical protein
MGHAVVYANELYHFGVLGMKWGIHRSREVKAVRSEHKKRQLDIDKASEARSDANWGGKKRIKPGTPEHQKMMKLEDKNAKQTKKEYDTEQRKYQSELKTAKNQAANRLYSLNGKRLNAKVNSLSLGQAVAESYLLGSYGSLKYHQARERDYSAGKAIVTSLLKTSLNGMALGIPGAVEYLSNVRQRHVNKSN